LITFSSAQKLHCKSLTAQNRALKHRGLSGTLVYQGLVTSSQSERIGLVGAMPLLTTLGEAVRLNSVRKKGKKGKIWWNIRLLNAAGA
jgi:hypothetical protein